MTLDFCLKKANDFVDLKKRCYIKSIVTTQHVIKYYTVTPDIQIYPHYKSVRIKKILPTNVGLSGCDPKSDPFLGPLCRLYYSLSPFQAVHFWYFLLICADGGRTETDGRWLLVGQRNVICASRKNAKTSYLRSGDQLI